MNRDDSVISWLLDSDESDPSLRWQVMRDLLDAPKSEWSAERAKVETDGWGARLLELEDQDGQWDGGAYFPGAHDWDNPEPGQPWTGTTHVLDQLRELGLPPTASRSSVGSS